MKYAVLTSDLQHAAAWKHEARKTAVQAFLPGQVQFLEQCRSRGVPVLHLQLVIDDDDPRNIGIDPAFSFARSSSGVRLLGDIVCSTDIIIEKSKDSGFFETSLDAKLKELQVDCVILTGMQAQICIQTTAADAFFRGYKILIPREGVVSTRADDVERALKWLESYCAEILSYDEVISRLENQFVGA